MKRTALLRQLGDTGADADAMNRRQLDDRLKAMLMKHPRLVKDRRLLKALNMDDADGEEDEAEEEEKPAVKPTTSRCALHRSIIHSSSHII